MANTTIYKGRLFAVVLNLMVASRVRVLLCAIRVLTHTFSVAGVVAFTMQSLIGFAMVFAVGIVMTTVSIVTPVPGASVASFLPVILGVVGFLEGIAAAFSVLLLSSLLLCFNALLLLFNPPEDLLDLIQDHLLC
eukprot:2572638-Ditylum_brightwellii.AAC.1